MSNTSFNHDLWPFRVNHLAIWKLPLYFQSSRIIWPLVELFDPRQNYLTPGPQNEQPALGYYKNLTLNRRWKYLNKLHESEVSFKPYLYTEKNYNQWAFPSNPLAKWIPYLLNLTHPNKIEVGIVPVTY